MEKNYRLVKRRSTKMQKIRQLCDRLGELQHSQPKNVKDLLGKAKHGKAYQDNLIRLLKKLVKEHFKGGQFQRICLDDIADKRFWDVPHHLSAQWHLINPYKIHAIALKDAKTLNNFDIRFKRLEYK